MRRGVVPVVLLWLAGGGVSAAQEILTLEGAIEQGLRHSARLAELEARQSAAEAIEAGRTAARLPVVAAQAGYMRTNHVEEFSIVAPGQPARLLYPDVPDNYRTRLDLQWPIYTAGRVDALQRAARAEALATAEDVAAARADLRLEITRAYWALATARDTERVLGRSLESVDAHVRDLRSRLEQGLIPPNDLLTAEAQRARQRVSALEATNVRAIAEADLRRLTGASAPIPTVADPAAFERTTESPAGLEIVPAVRAERRALDQRLAAAREREAASRALFKPQVGVAAGYDVARPNPRIFPRADRWEDSWDASINLTWTLWDGGRRSAERAEAAAATRAAHARVTEFDRTLAFELEARRLDLDTARAAVGAAAEGVRAAVEARRVIAERYAAGVAISTDVLAAEIAVLHAELDRARTHAAVRLAEARLARAAGESR